MLTEARRFERAVGAALSPNGMLNPVLISLTPGVLLVAGH